MNQVRVAINGFGRIGRIAARIILTRSDLKLVAINSKADSSSHAYLLKYDSTYGTLKNDIQPGENRLRIDGENVDVYQIDTPSEIPWKKSKVDVVIEATGKYSTSADLNGHLKAGAKRVVLSAPAKDDTKTLVIGVNEKSFDPKVDTIISNSSCTTNCLATTLAVIDDAFGVTQGVMTTVHAVTDSQNLLDNSHKKEVRLRRASFASMIPASTGSANDIGKLFPRLRGFLSCRAIRVPLLTVSLIVLSVWVDKPTTVESINSAFRKASAASMRGVVDVAKDELVSKDFTGNPHSSIIDPYLTTVTSPKFATVYAWYDNEFGYTSRLVDMVSFVGKSS
ncbi:type I glyceraldehyde-3-phosphate dehydrogenase [Candidatus Gottesmanbacteria bacterium]|nr:type I glyceraldehyde-3-phosphate dehydrogenase [Candidatus Gottesmanbacteria bacterium]